MDLNIHKEDVYLNIYDLNENWNKYAHPIGFGAYHSNFYKKSVSKFDYRINNFSLKAGIEVYGKEYCFYGHSLASSGIYTMIPKDIKSFDRFFSYKQSIKLGTTIKSKKEVEDLIEFLGIKYKGTDYHLVFNNCNNFSNTLSKMLCDTELPIWINRLTFYLAFIPLMNIFCPRKLNELVQRHRKIRAIERKIVNVVFNIKKVIQNDIFTFLDDYYPIFLSAYMLILNLTNKHD